MLGFFTTEGRGQGDLILQEVAQSLVAQGLVVTGVVQINVEYDPERRCHMDLQVLGGGDVIRISQERGRFARGCRLDAGQLAQAVHQVDQALATGGAQVLLVNKFGKQECDGEGFREVIATALAMDVPVLTTVSPGHRAAFAAFAQGFETELPAAPEALAAWCRSQLARPQDAAE